MTLAAVGCPGEPDFQVAADVCVFSQVMVDQRSARVRGAGFRCMAPPLFELTINYPGPATRPSEQMILVV